MMVTRGGGKKKGYVKLSGSSYCGIFIVFIILFFIIFLIIC